MKKWKWIPVFSLMLGSLAGCSKFEVSENTVRIAKDGSIQAAVIETLDKNYYNAEELKTMIDEAVADYNGSGEEEPVSVESFETEEDKVSLYMDYASAKDYETFNQVTFYLADLQQAYDNNYVFPENFRKVEKGEMTGTVPKSELLTGLNYSVLIYSEEMDVEVPGTIVYTSTDVTVTGKKTATNRKTDGQEETNTEDTKDSQTEQGEFEVEEGTFEAGDGDADETEAAGEESVGAYTFIVYEPK